MPVILPAPPQGPPPAPPNPFVSVGACVLVMAGAAGYALYTWPKNIPVGTLWFWMRVAGFPALGCALLYGFRLLYFERQRERLDAQTVQWKEDCAEATWFAQEPLALLGLGYLCAQGSFDVARAMIDGDRPLESHIPAAGAQTVRHTRLSLIDDPLLVDRHASCLRELLAMLDDAIRLIPETVPFEVHLHCPGNIGAGELLAIWQTCWAQTSRRSVEASVLGRDEGVMALDAWLDGYGGPALEKVALFVAVQLHDTPPVNSAEAAVALLLGWAPVIQRTGLPVPVLLHRPVEQLDGPLSDALRTALLWGRAQAPDVEDVWQTGLAPADIPALLDAAAQVKLGASQTRGLPGFHDMDPATGHAGVADAWLALALAAEHAASTGKAQMVATRQQAIRLAVVQPHHATNEQHEGNTMETSREGSA
ncbi:hypothetical protein [Paraburkholderia bannensis]|uniref:hypothetical protein n=1 Tax=Paraburkholderia bannensis TaxID=765414 RepID=UPI002ABD77D3|nr:hypothetical protein [Paraburkholderia bannensis]